MISIDDKFSCSPDILKLQRFAARSAAHFWLEKKLYVIADEGSSQDAVNAITDLVNKQTNSRVDRIRHFRRLWSSKALE